MVITQRRRLAGLLFGVLGMSILYRVKVPSLPASGKD